LLPNHLPNAKTATYQLIFGSVFNAATLDAEENTLMVQVATTMALITAKDPSTMSLSRWEQLLQKVKQVFIAIPATMMSLIKTCQLI